MGVDVARLYFATKADAQASADRLHGAGFAASAPCEAESGDGWVVRSLGPLALLRRCTCNLVTWLNSKVIPRRPAPPPPREGVEDEWVEGERGRGHRYEPRITVAANGACDQCKAPVLWIYTERGARMPLDLDVWALEPGKGRARGVDRDGVVYAGVRREGPAEWCGPETRAVVTAHAATCVRRRRG